jgi:hypothetical protein
MAGNIGHRELLERSVASVSAIWRAG